MLPHITFTGLVGELRLSKVDFRKNSFKIVIMNFKNLYGEIFFN